MAEPTFLAHDTTNRVVSKPRVVLDTNVCLDLFVFRGPRCMTLSAALQLGEYIAVTREDCRAEWLAVLDYAQLALDAERRAQARDAFDTYVTCLPQSELSARSEARLPRCTDPDDQKFLELAWEAGAVALLTRDKALLRLKRRAVRDGLFTIATPETWSVDVTTTCLSAPLTPS